MTDHGVITDIQQEVCEENTVIGKITKNLKRLKSKYCDQQKIDEDIEDNNIRCSSIPVLAHGRRTTTKTYGGNHVAL